MTSSTLPRSAAFRTIRLPARIEADPLDRATILIALLGIPIGLLGGDVFGFAIGGWAWAAAAGVGLLGLLMVPVPLRALRLSAPLLAYLLFGVATMAWTIDPLQGVQTLSQYLTVLVVYIAAYRAAGRDPELLEKLRGWALWVLPSAAFVFIRAMGDGASRFGWIRGGNAARPMVMSVAILYLLSTAGRSRRFTIVVGAGAFITALGSGGRMGTAVVALLILLNPAMRFSWRTRLMMLMAGLVVFAAALQLEAVQERLFVGRSEGTVSDIVTLDNNFNTAGRSNNWPAIFASCERQPTLGFGAGSTRQLTLEATNGRTGHPHNEFLRIYCESGIVGELLFWSFFVAAAWRGAVSFRKNGSEIGTLAVLTVLTLVLFASTDNATIYTSVFMAPVALVLGMADRLQETPTPSVSRARMSAS